MNNTPIDDERTSNKQSDAVIRDHGGWDMGLQFKSYPSDSVVNAALSAWNGTGGSDRVAMRAALRAAEGVR